MPVSRNETLERQLVEIGAVKRQLAIKMQHLERIKRITKSESDRAQIDRELHELRMTFLNYADARF